jgi:hypothetical protein
VKRKKSGKETSERIELKYLATEFLKVKSNNNFAGRNGNENR